MPSSEVLDQRPSLLDSPQRERHRLSVHHDEDSIAAAGWSRGLGAHISDLSQEVEGTLWELYKVLKHPP